MDDCHIDGGWLFLSGCQLRVEQIDAIEVMPRAPQIAVWAGNIYGYVQGPEGSSPEAVADQVRSMIRMSVD